MIIFSLLGIRFDSIDDKLIIENPLHSLIIDHAM